MHDTDQLVDSAELREMRDRLFDLTMPHQPRLKAITARGRARQRHRLFAVVSTSLAGAAAATALALTLTGVLSSAASPDTIRTAAFTIVSSPDGTVTLTMNPGEVLQPAVLQSDLAQHGIPATVTSGSFCSSDPTPDGFSQVVTFQPSGGGTWTPQSGVQPTLTINPFAMPDGTELSFGYFQLPTGQQQAHVALIDTSSYTCTSTPPALGPDTPGWGLEYGGPGPS